MMLAIVVDGGSTINSKHLKITLKRSIINWRIRSKQKFICNPFPELQSSFFRVSSILNLTNT